MKSADVTGKTKCHHLILLFRSLNNQLIYLFTQGVIITMSFKIAHVEKQTYSFKLSICLFTFTEARGSSVFIQQQYRPQSVLVAASQEQTAAWIKVKQGMVLGCAAAAGMEVIEPQLENYTCTVRGRLRWYSTIHILTVTSKLVRNTDSIALDYFYGISF